jgi:hypothetical protein
VKSDKTTLIKERLVELISSSTFHALPNIVKTKSKVVKVMWIVCFLVSSGFCANLVIQSLTNYLKFDVVSLTRAVYEPFSEFPAILLCNKNNVKFEVFNESEIEEINNKTRYLNISEVHTMLEFARKRVFSKYNFENNRNSNFNVQLDELLITCRHGSWYCNVSDFKPFFHFTHGGCYLLNAKRLRKIYNETKLQIYRPGFDNSLQMELFIGEENQLDILSSSTGFELIILNSSDFSNKLDYLNLAPGFEYNVAIHKTVIEQIPKPYSGCEVEEANLDTFDSEYVKIFLKNNLTYKQADCLDLCYQILSEEYCNCTDFILFFSFSSKICKNDREIECIVNYKKEIFTKENYIQKNCIPQCPLECNRIELSTTVSFSKYPSDSYFEILKGNKKLQETVFKSANWSHIKNSILKVNINFESLSYKYIRENVVMSVVDLLAYIGGQMSLFLGISVLSFFEILELLYQVAYIVFFQKI